MVFTVVDAIALIVVVLFVAAVVVVYGSLAVTVAFAVADVAVVTFVDSESMNLHREICLLLLPGFKPKPLAK